MTGDFFALLPKNPFPSVSGDVRNPMPLEATTVFAFHCAEGVIIGTRLVLAVGEAGGRTEAVADVSSFLRSAREALTAIG